MTLQQQQLAVQALIAQHPVATHDPWLESVAESPGLHQIHRIASWWQRFQLESQCRYTTRLMKRLGCFERLVEEHFLANPTPPSIEELSVQFLSFVERSEVPLLASVARFELACLTQTDQPSIRRTILWDRNPNLVLAALDGFGPLPPAELGTQYRLIMDASLADGLSCIREATE